MKLSFHEDRLVGLLLTFIGGALDGYTYIHYNAFASAQTGNIILALSQMIDGNWAGVGKKLLSTLFFCVGLLLAKFMIDFFRKKEIVIWRLYILYFEAIIFFIVSLTSINNHPAVVTIIISFTAAIQWITFDKIEGRAYTNLFTTGNLKGLMTSSYDYMYSKAPADLQRCFHYLFVVIAFILGAFMSIFLYKAVGLEEKAVLLAAGACLVLALSETYLVIKFYRLEKWSK
ncbi:YoaK family protein [Vagococcus vulneris]|uniref:DUF1275 family protein n=1 Tax=Vagococcus vulneris TaxID=1977869 RepID=A0A429ZXV8_9ENTE|nr:YoaK family protein [Vagococcus vulneris]RST98737.1 hypothetical protein CBF37_06730 [Vagococcus vulneris]